MNQLLVQPITAESLRPKIAQLVSDLKASGWWWYWSDEAMQQCLESDFYQNRVDNYLLWKYELHISNKHHPKPTLVSYQDLISNESIEHIAPQTPTNGEPEVNGYGAYVDKVTPQEGIQSGGWLNSLGNLMLVSGPHNSRIGNHPFAEKLDSYGKDNLLMQQREIIEFLASKEGIIPKEKVIRWDKAAIQARHERLIVAANTIWNLDNILQD
ncbi:HNH endonuclease family protein [Hymenobacter volaticus]|uniref:HNH endonuclease family protein n=1 Tax=Hymenobacter volaticus TaxID=2932254 RepID=A0ABY4GEJ9_9BACT|nr:HNH endonuclease family protein [Hymenobacter volaticus]UOQ69172.1 HNH endonuclease family protein [Hymenobacter volaticus]